MEVEEGRVRAIVSLGSNIEPRVEYLSRAVDALAAFPETKLVAPFRHVTGVAALASLTDDDPERTP